MAYSGVTISIAKGKSVPKAYMELALKENPSTCSFAFYDTKEKAIRYMRDQARPPTDDNDGKNHDDGNPQFTADQLVAEMDKYKDFGVILHLSNSDDELEAECEQPFEVLVDAQKEPVMLAFVEGDFSSYTQPTAIQTDEYFAANKFIIPFIKKLYAAANQDMSKLMAELNDPVNKQILGNAAISGVTTLVTAGFAPVSFDKGSGGSTFPWGWVSKTYGYKEQAPSAPVKSGLVSAAKGLISRRDRGPVIPPADVPVVDEPMPDDGVADPGNKEGPRGEPKTDVAAAHQELAEGEHEMITPDAKLKGKSLPNWYDHPAAPTKKILKAFEDMPKPADVKYTHTDTRKTVEVLPIIPADKIERNKLHFVNLDRNNKELDDDPKTWTGLVAKHPTLTQQQGVDDYAYDNKSYKWFKELLDMDKQDGTDSIAILCFDFRNRLKEQEEMLGDLTKPDQSDTTGQPPQAAGQLKSRRR